MPLNEKNVNAFKVVGNQVVLDKNYLTRSFKYFKKITGTRFSAILNKSKYNSPFKTWMGMVNLYKDVIDPTLALVGNTIEPAVRDYVSKLLNIDFKVYEPSKIGWDVFSENKIFGGIPDGEPMINGEVDYSNDKPMLEIKTSSIDSFVFRTNNNCLTMQKDDKGIPLVKNVGEKRASWFVNDEITIPSEYQLQLALYMYLRNINHGVFAVAFLNKEDYANPNKFNPNDHEVKLVDFHISDLNQIKSYIDYATKWYEDYIVKGISPEMTEDDKTWLKKEMSYIS